MQTDISELENGQLAEQQLPSDFTLVVLAGGASSHMGREKSDLLLDGQTFLEIQIGKGCQLGAKQILISGYRGTQCGEEIVPDRISGQGPLGGLESCFRRAKTEKCLVLGVDTPLVPVEELQNLLKFAMEKADQPVTMLCHNGKEECSRLGNSGRYERSLCFSGIRCIRLSQRSNHSGGWRVSRKIA